MLLPQMALGGVGVDDEEQFLADSVAGVVGLDARKVAEEALGRSEGRRAQRDMVVGPVPEDRLSCRKSATLTPVPWLADGAVGQAGVHARRNAEAVA